MVVNIAYLPKVCISHNYHGVIVILKKLKDLSQNYKNRRYRVKTNRIYGTYNINVMPHGRHIYAKTYDMAKAKMCAYSHSYHELPHWKCVLPCCAKCLRINLPDQETDDKYPYTSTSIFFSHLSSDCKLYKTWQDSVN